MKDFGPISILAITREFFEPWLWPIVIFVALLVLVYAAALVRKRSLGSLIRAGFVPALVLAVLFAAFMLLAVPTLTKSSWAYVAGAVDVLFIALIALAFGAALFLLALPLAALVRGRAPS